MRPGCQDTIEVIAHELLAEAVAHNAGLNDPTPYGAALAGRVVDPVDRGVTVAYSHCDYCRMGLDQGDDGYVYGCVCDGQLLTEGVFKTREALTGWLAQQSYVRLSGWESPQPFDGNKQRITRVRLLAAAATMTPD